MTRVTATSRTLQAGCYICHGTRAHWIQPNAQAVAVRHHDQTGHPTWCDVLMQVRYGVEGADPRQIDIEDSIAATLAGEPGDRPVSIPRPDIDASAVAPADVSAPRGRSSRSALAAPQPEPAHV